MKFTKHVAVEMAQDQTQRCVICGEMIYDNRGMMASAGTPPSKGYPRGPVYISDTRNPRITVVESPEPDGYEILSCKP